eukprot:COSAG03_NODE_10069_length_674_cov_1.490435_1_plen_66_part_10
MASQQRGELGPDAGEGALVDLPAINAAEEPADAEGEPMEVFLRCALCALSPLPLIWPYKSEKSLCG